MLDNHMLRRMGPKFTLYLYFWTTQYDFRHPIYIYIYLTFEPNTRSRIIILKQRFINNHSIVKCQISALQVLISDKCHFQMKGNNQKRKIKDKWESWTCNRGDEWRKEKTTSFSHYKWIASFLLYTCFLLVIFML